jgi:pimeloyl-ACP methyl ester carboxylesterase
MNNCILVLAAFFSSIHALAGPLREDRFIEINGDNQFISIRSSKGAEKPVLLFLHGGPGASATVMFQHFCKELENDFIVVCWDQRGAGKSFKKNLPKETITVKQMIEDGLAVTDYLRERFSQNSIFLIGHSWGARLGMYLIRIHPEKYKAYMGVGQEVCAFEGEKQSYHYTLQKALEQNNSQAIKDLEEMGETQSGRYLEMYKTGFWGLVKQKDWLLKLGGERYGRTNYKDWIAIMAKGYGYNPLYMVKWSKASSSTNGAIIHDPGFNEFDFRRDIPEVNVPVHFVSGQQDYNTPWPLVKEYYEQMRAPEKSFTSFGKSGHSPLFEEALSFCRVVKEKFLGIQED